MLACKQKCSWVIMSTQTITTPGLLCSNNGHGGDLPWIAFDNILTKLALVSKCQQIVSLHPDNVANKTGGCLSQNHQPQVPTTSRLPVLPPAMLQVSVLWKAV